MEPSSYSRNVMPTCSTEVYPELHGPSDCGLRLLRVKNEYATAIVALQGAHVMSFRPDDQPEMLWISPKCVLESGKPIRGGIPLCLPWFGPSADGSILHGFARTLEWRYVASNDMDDGATKVILELARDSVVCDLWPHAFVFQLELVVGERLELRLMTRNVGAETAPLSFAFHTYFAVENVLDARIEGLEGVSFVDKTDGSMVKVQRRSVSVNSESAYFYRDVPRKQTLRTPDQGVTVESDTRCAVVWNAGIKDKNIDDIGEGNHKFYVCLERGDLAEYATNLRSGEEYRATLLLSYTQVPVSPR